MHNLAPLVVRLRDLGPALSAEARARLALDRIHAADARAEQEQATLDLLAQRSSGERIEEFVPTAEVSMEAWNDRLLQLGVLDDRNPRRRPAHTRGLLRLVRGAR